MTDFKILRDDYKIQKSVFGNKYEIVVNFSDENFVYKNYVISPNDLLEYDKYNIKITDYGLKIIETNDNYTRIELETDIFNYNETNYYSETVSFTIETEVFNHMIKYVNDVQTRI